MAEAVVNLVFLGLMYLAVIVCVLAPVAAIGFILWNWRTRAVAASGLGKDAIRRTEDL
jgi:hypothetical protein